MTGGVRFPELKDRNGSELVIRRFEEVYIERTFKQMTQFAEVTMPRAGFLFNDKNVKEVFKPGMEVIVELGYDGNNVEEFRGYITRVSADVPVRLRLEDEMWKVKRIPVNYVGKNVMLHDLLKTLASDYEVDALEVKLGNVRFSKTNLGAVLDKLQSEWKLNSYFVGKKLVCGKYYSVKTDSLVSKFDLERNTVGNALNYKNKEDVILKIDATSILVNGDKIEFSLGDEGGDNMSLTYYNITAKAELEKKVKADYERAKLGGFDGSFTAFGVPTVDFGEKVQLTSSLYPDRDGIYYVEGVNKTFSSSGYRQEIKLGGLVS